MINWRGVPYYLGKTLLGSRQWKACLREVRRSDFEALSQTYLLALLRHAGDNVPYYRDLGLSGASLADYPILSKSQLRHTPEVFQRADLANHRWTRVVTSGSTGEPLEVLQDESAAAWFEATDTWYLRELLATTRWEHITQSKVRLWSQAMDRGADASVLVRIAHVLEPRTWLSPYDALSEERLVEYAHAIDRARPAFIWAFAGVLYEVARTILHRGLRTHSPRFIISSGETLHSFMRPVIEEAFDCRVYNHYGSAETGHVAGECSAGNLHVFSFSSHVEVLDPEGKPAPPGSEGSLVLTPLHNYAMPLIRYDTADVAQVGPVECPCGCRLPSLSRIAGRTVEFFVSEDGALISGGRIAQLMRHCQWVVGFQILQRDVDRMTIFFTQTAEHVDPQSDIERVNQEIAHIIGAGCKVTWQKVAEIPRTPNGKRPYARSLVWENRQPMSLWAPTSEGGGNKPAPTHRS